MHTSPSVPTFVSPLLCPSLSLSTNSLRIYLKTMSTDTIENRTSTQSYSFCLFLKALHSLHQSSYQQNQCIKHPSLLSQPKIQICIMKIMCLCSRLSNLSRYGLGPAADPALNTRGGGPPIDRFAEFGHRIARINTWPAGAVN